MWSEFKFCTKQVENACKELNGSQIVQKKKLNGSQKQTRKWTYSDNRDWSVIVIQIRFGFNHYVPYCTH